MLWYKKVKKFMFLCNLYIFIIIKHIHLYSYNPKSEYLLLKYSLFERALLY